MARRKRPRGVRTTQTQDIEQFGDGQPLTDTPPEPIQEVDAPNPLIPDEEIEAEVQARDEAADEIADGMAALAELDDEHDESQAWPEGSPERRAIEAGIGRFPRPGLEHEDEPQNSPVENFTEEWPNPLGAEPEFDPEIFERGPLAAGIRMCEALLTEARAGYISAQIEELERVLDESFADPERFFLGNVAAQERTASGLPDVAGAYKALVRAKASVQS